MIKFFTQMHPKIPTRGSNVVKHPECLTVVNGTFVFSGTPKRNYVEKTDKDHPQKKAKEEKQKMQFPGFAHPEPLNDEGLLAQKVKQQIEEYKKKKDKPTLHNPEGRE